MHFSIHMLKPPWQASIKLRYKRPKLSKIKVYSLMTSRSYSTAVLIQSHCFFFQSGCLLYNVVIFTMRSDALLSSHFCFSYAMLVIISSFTYSVVLAQNWIILNRPRYLSSTFSTIFSQLVSDNQALNTVIFEYELSCIQSTSANLITTVQKK